MNELIIFLMEPEWNPDGIQMMEPKSCYCVSNKYGANIGNLFKKTILNHNLIQKI